MKEINFDKGIKSVEQNFGFEFNGSITYTLFREMKDVSDVEWEKICIEINKRKYKPKISDFIEVKKEIVKPVYHDDGKNYPVRCSKCDHTVAVKYSPGIEKNYICGHCIEDENVPF